MISIEDVVLWLSDGEDWEASNILSQCDFVYADIDWDLQMEIEMAGHHPSDHYILKIEAPRRILEHTCSELKSEVDIIEKTIYECIRSQNVTIHEIHWVPKLRSDTSSPPDPEIEDILSTLDSNQVKSIWVKAMNRRQSDPDGAITAAKTLLESVCKHILVNEGVKYPANPDITKLYHIVCKQLMLSPNQHVDKTVKTVLGNCNAVVSGIAFIRNNLGDAHSLEPGAVSPTQLDAELAVNLAGAVATFLVRTWEKQKKNTETPSQVT